MKTTLLVVGLLATGTAQANHYGLHATGSMSVRGVAEASVRLQPTVDGWFLPLAVPPNGTACRVELKDVSPVPGPLLKWVERVEMNAPSVTLWLDPERYLASHTYRMTLRCGLHDVARGLVHLAAPADPRALQRFRFSPGTGAEAGEMAIAPKGAL